MAAADAIGSLRISSVIFQSNCTNIGSLIKPLHVLDNILSNEVDLIDIVQYDSKDTSILKGLFHSVLSGQ